MRKLAASTVLLSAACCLAVRNDIAAVGDALSPSSASPSPSGGHVFTCPDACLECCAKASNSLLGGTSHKKFKCTLKRTSGAPSTAAGPCEEPYEKTYNRTMRKTACPYTEADKKAKVWEQLGKTYNRTMR